MDSAGSWMTPKQRLLQALTAGIPDVLPAAPAYPSLYLETRRQALYAEQVRHRLGGRSRYRIDHDEDTRFRADALVQSYAVFGQRPDWLEVRCGPSRAWAHRTDVVAVAGDLFFEDRPSGERSPILDHRPTAGVWDAKDKPGDARSVDDRLPVYPCETLLAGGAFDLPRLIAAEHGDEYPIVTILDTPFSDAYDLFGFEGLMMIQHDDPSLLHHVLARLLAVSRELMAAWAEVGAVAAYVEEVFTGADLLSPRSYDRFVFKYNLPYFRHLRSLGLLAVHYVCGDVMPRLDRMVELDIAAVAVEESKKGFSINLEEVVGRVGHQVAVFGNIDTIRFGLHGSCAAMAAEVRRQAAIGRGARGFVVSTGSPFPLDTDPQVIDSLIAAAHTITAGQGLHAAP